MNYTVPSNWLKSVSRNLISQANTMFSTYWGTAPYQEVYKLLSAIGIYGNANYTIGSTSMNNDSIVPTLSHFGFSSQKIDYFNSGNIISELSNNRPVIMVGASSSSAHCWIVDGALCVSHFEGYVDPATGEIIENTILEEYHYTDYNTYLWVNWGAGLPPDKKHYQYWRDSYLYDIPIQVNSNVFAYNANIIYNQYLKMWIGITPQ